VVKGFRVLYPFLSFLTCFPFWKRYSWGSTARDSRYMENVQLTSLTKSEFKVGWMRMARRRQGPKMTTSPNWLGSPPTLPPNESCIGSYVFLNVTCTVYAVKAVKRRAVICEEQGAK